MQVFLGLFCIFVAVKVTVVEGEKIQCFASEATVGGTAYLTCVFNEDVSAVKKDFNVRRVLEKGQPAKDFVVDCYWDGELKCPKLGNGIEVDSMNISNRVRLRISNVTKDHEGKYVCQTIPSNPGDLRECILTVTEERHTTRQTKTQESDANIKEGRYTTRETTTQKTDAIKENSVVAIAASVAVVVVCAVVVILIVVLVRRRRNRRNVPREVEAEAKANASQEQKGMLTEETRKYKKGKKANTPSKYAPKSAKKTKFSKRPSVRAIRKKQGRVKKQVENIEKKAEEDCEATSEGSSAEEDASSDRQDSEDHGQIVTADDNKK